MSNRLKLLDEHINNIHYYLPNSVSFLRMHKPAEFGDDLSKSRPIVETVNREKIEKTGFEVGKFGFYLRVTAPLYHEKRHIGALGLGLSLMTTLDDLEMINNGINFISLPNKEISSKKIKYFCNIGDHVIFNTGKNIILASSKKDLSRFTSFFYSDKNYGHEVVRKGSKHYLINYSIKIKNFQDKEIATIISVQDVSASYNNFYNKLGRIILLSLFSLLIIILAINRSFNRYLNQNHELNKKYFQTKLKLQTINLKLNPHFLFNALNVISELIYKNKAEAESNILKLSKLLRSYLSSADKITIEQELSLTEDYCYLQNTRFNNIHTIRIRALDKSFLNVEIPKFSIQLLVENAFKHGIEDRKAIIIKIKVYRRADRVIISISNTGKKLENLTKGFGLNNLETRLKEGYNGRLNYWHRCGVTNFTITVYKEENEIFSN